MRPVTVVTAAKVSRSKQRKSFSRGRTHIGQQRRRARTVSTCSDLQPGSPSDLLEPLSADPGEVLEGPPIAAPEPEVAMPQCTPEASPPYSGSPAPMPRHANKYPKTKKVHGSPESYSTGS